MVNTRRQDKKPETIRRKHKNTGAFSIYIYRILKNLHPTLTISKMGMAVMNSLVLDIFERLCAEAGNIVQHCKKQTLTSREIAAAVQLVLRGELAKGAASRGVHAIAQFSKG